MNYHKFSFIIGIITIIVVNTVSLYAQKDIKVTPEELKKIGTNYFNYSDPAKVNIEVKVLGGVRYPGIYLVPEGTSVIDLLSLSGNVLQEETADNIKLIRTSQQSGRLSDDNIITLNYRDMFKDEKLKSINKVNPVLVYGDILVVPMTPEKTFWDFFRDFSIVITPLVTLATLVISIISLSRQ
jgi:hypothetical protein